MWAPGRKPGASIFRFVRSARFEFAVGVIDTSGGPPHANLVVMVLPGESGPGMPGRNSAAVRNQDGTFEVRGVAPGTYIVTANRINRDPGGTRSSASMPLTVGNRDVEGVTLTLAPPAEVTGAIHVEGNAQLNLGSVRVFLEPMSGMTMFGGGMQAPVASGAFKLAGVPPGHYRIRATNLPDGTYVKSVKQGPQEILESGLQLSGAVVPLDIVLGSNAPSITGTVTDAPNVSVALIPDMPRRNQYHLYATTTSGDTGSFTFRNVTPGDYKVFVLAQSEVEGVQNPAFVNQIESRGTSVRLVEGKTESLQLAVK